VIFNLPGYRVIDALDLPLGGRRVRVQAESLEAGCPDCGVVSSRVHAWTLQPAVDNRARVQNTDRVEEPEQS
jgi:hypothetical protein